MLRTTVLSLTLVLVSGGLAQELGPAPYFPDKPSYEPSHARLSPHQTSPFWYDTQDRAAIRDLFNYSYAPTANVPMNWSGNLATGNPGDTSADYKTAALTRINWFRAMAGVAGSIFLDSTYNRKAQQAAMMMSSNGTLSHNPPASWINYTAEGAEAAGKSNLCLGFTFDPGCVALYMQDHGSGNSAAGHRRWILDPRTQRMGTGDIPSHGSYRPANALWVIDSTRLSARPDTRDEFVAWPPPGYVPYQTVHPRWSFALDRADFSNATVTMTKSGSSIPVRTEPIANGYGENTIVFVPDNQNPNFTGTHPKPASDVPYVVTIGNVLVNSIPRNFQYTVVVFDPSSAPPPPCVIALNPAAIWTSARTGAAAFEIQTGASCPWVGSQLPSWISLDPPSGVGPANVLLSFQANSGELRSASVPIGNSTLTVNQNGPHKDPRSFVRYLYLDIQNREPDAASWDMLTALVRDGYPREQMAKEFLLSPEFLGIGGLFAVRCYFALLERDPDAAGWAQWFGLLRSGHSQKWVIERFIESPEFTAKYGGNLTNTQFMELLYRNILGREPDAAGLAAWVSSLDLTQSTRADAVYGFLLSTEYDLRTRNRAYAVLLYLAFLRRSGEPAGVAAWEQWLASSAFDLTGAIRGFIDSPEYSLRY